MSLSAKRILAEKICLKTNCEGSKHFFTNLLKMSEDSLFQLSESLSDIKTTHNYLSQEEYNSRLKECKKEVEDRVRLDCIKATERVYHRIMGSNATRFISELEKELSLKPQSDDKKSGNWAGTMVKGGKE